MRSGKVDTLMIEETFKQLWWIHQSVTVTVHHFHQLIISGAMKAIQFQVQTDQLIWSMSGGCFGVVPMKEEFHLMMVLDQNYYDVYKVMMCCIILFIHYLVTIKFFFTSVIPFFKFSFYTSSLRYLLTSPL